MGIVLNVSMPKGFLVIGLRMIYALGVTPIPQETKVSSLVGPGSAAADHGLVLARREKIRFFRSKLFPQETEVRQYGSFR